MVKKYYLGEASKKRLDRVSRRIETRTRSPLLVRRRRTPPAGRGGFPFTIRFGITMEETPGSVGGYETGVIPGVFLGEYDIPTENLLLFDYGVEAGDLATPGTLVIMENYAPGIIEIHKGMMVFERSTNIWVPVSQFCEVFDSGSGS